MLSWLFSQNQWALHNPLKSWTLKGLNDRELKLIAGTLTAAEMNLTLIWKKGWTEWKRLNQVEGFMAAENALTMAGAPPIPANALHHQEDEITQVKIASYEPVRLRKDRRHNRHEVCVPVEIVQSSQSFRTETLDVSESGVRFKDDIPDWVAGYFTVIFRFDTTPFEVTCALVEDQKKKKDCAEVFDTNDEESGLQRYLEWVRSMHKD
jgi:hypothetical protein